MTDKIYYLTANGVIGLNGAAMWTVWQAAIWTMLHVVFSGIVIAIAGFRALRTEQTAPKRRWLLIPACLIFINLLGIQRQPVLAATLLACVVLSVLWVGAIYWSSFSWICLYHRWYPSAERRKQMLYVAASTTFLILFVAVILFPPVAQARSQMKQQIKHPISAKAE